MGLLRLCICVSGVYAAFLLWAIAQERLSQPFPASPAHPHTPPRSAHGDKFPSPLFFNFSQALASACASATYLLVGSRGSLARDGVVGVLGLRRLFGGAEVSDKPNAVARSNNANGKANGANGNTTTHANVNTTRPHANGNGNTARPWYQTLPGLLLQVSMFQTTAGPIGFHALKHISYPTMVLAKSCKLIPVLLLNVLLYRRRFGAHKYAVVVLVSIGISMFMLFGGKKKGGGGDSAFGLGLLLVNLLIDGLTNSTQDQIFALYPSYSGQQMMFIMAFLQLSLLTPAMLLPLPSRPSSLVNHIPFLSSLLPRERGYSHTLSFSPPILLQSVRFLVSHPTALAPLAAYAALGGLGQLFIFETIAHFGSLTLVMVTVTRKLFTMLLSVFVFGHKLTPGQWCGVAVVFAGIGVEAGFKRREASKRVRRDKAKTE
ncbi:hypothetical protein CcaverHIS002_0202300 [Cutaneotrichosporon cavernicola]|uniref:UDP-galactose transporter homolog 1 n=1 Tax=Cutaneotrichosporon cavernicola TaxID=279322 RepID=A0AA48I6P5_9TREE|nr:uncharacterized protein CcaverHIS019_0202320 [Cutaneotrichosporon cavernicola]BEI81070.1 hypothetical protein CcaverHIS002_0202300 [Cutaneotrichosporon cavernicola]BEI88870.1 hypothetical protein CcaverHIS019_0202320 [Cutaneotrichosporon cavernicola]BEI96646.1 hypothetical protein CcaverHIS631_0202350 [Cutaneotrichosporon cavernicola]BEJ04419.1 hypothetical protein CcaverHIS641_0202360 [Cutaneotrichosporon cavernicola]